MTVKKFASPTITNVDLILAKDILQVQNFPKFAKVPRFFGFLFSFFDQILAILVFGGSVVVGVDMEHGKLDSALDFWYFSDDVAVHDSDFFVVVPEGAELPSVFGFKVEAVLPDLFFSELCFLFLGLPLSDEDSAGFFDVAVPFDFLHFGCFEHQLSEFSVLQQFFELFL